MVGNFVYNDGGRAKANYKGKSDDCVVRAIAIATGISYQEVYDALGVRMCSERLKRKRGNPRNGVHKSTYKPYIASLGWKWTPTMGIGTGCTVHLKGLELPSGRLIVSCSGHLVAVIDGVVHDTYDPTRNGTRCVYGFYWEK